MRACVRASVRACVCARAAVRARMCVCVSDGGQVRLKNPWCNTEWRGALSDSDAAGWTDDLRAALAYSAADARDDGVFWIPWEAVRKEREREGGRKREGEGGREGETERAEIWER